MLDLVRSSSTRGAWITLVVLLTAAIALCVLMVWPFLGSIIGGAVLAVIFYPLHLRIHKRITKRGVAALLTTLVVLAAFLVPLTLLVLTVMQEVRAAYQALAPVIAAQGADGIWAAVDRPLAVVGRWFGMESSELRTMLAERIQAAGPAIVGKTGAVLGAVGGGVVKIVIAVGTLYCTLLYGRALHKSAVTLSPLGRQRPKRCSRPCMK